MSRSRAARPARRERRAGLTEASEVPGFLKQIDEFGASLRYIRTDVVCSRPSPCAPPALRLRSLERGQMRPVRDRRNRSLVPRDWFSRILRSSSPRNRVVPLTRCASSDLYTSCFELSLYRLQPVAIALPAAHGTRINRLSRLDGAGSRDGRLVLVKVKTRVFPL